MWRPSASLLVLWVCNMVDEVPFGQTPFEMSSYCVYSKSLQMTIRRFLDVAGYIG
jgi:hypothetical protein